MQSARGGGGVQHTLETLAHHQAVCVSAVWLWRWPNGVPMSGVGPSRIVAH